MSEEFAERLPRTSEIVAGDQQAGQHKGIQLFVSLPGQTVADIAVGEAAPDRPLTTETRMAWLSSGKPLTALAIGRLVEAGRLAWEDTVATHLPEFEGKGKEQVTIRHLLTHTGGIAANDSGYPEATWDESIRLIAESPLEEGWEVGESAAYQPSVSWFLLGEIIARVSGRSFSEFLDDEILTPCGMPMTSFSIGEQQAGRLEEKLGWMWSRRGRELEPLDWHQFPRLGRKSPGSSARGPVRELATFYRQLLESLAGGPGAVFPSELVATMTRPHRVGKMDRTFRHTIDFGLGFLVNSNRYGPETVPYSFGRHASPRAFGHGGSQSSIAFADPEHGLVVAWATNAMIGEPRHQKRNLAINSAIYEDLGLA